MLMNIKSKKDIYPYFSVLITTLLICNTLLVGLVMGQPGPGGMGGNKPLADTEAPKFGQNWTKETGYTGDPFNFTINLTDNVAINNAYVNYTWSGAGVYFNMTMVNVSGDWTNVSIMPTFNTTITYNFSAVDTSNNWAHTTSGYVTIIDNDPPVNDSGSDNFTVGTGNGFTVYANFTDNVDTTNAVFYYCKVTESIYSSTDMNEGSEGNFTRISSFLIDTSTDDTDYYYYIIAKDSENNTVNYTYNETNNIPWLITVLDDDAPTYESGTGNLSINVNSGFTIYANFTDNLGVNNVSAANIYYKNATAGSYNTTSMQKTGPGEFKVTNVTMGIDTTDNDIDYLYRIWVNDTADNNDTYPNGYDFVIKVIDTIDPTVIDGSGDLIGLCSSGFSVYANFSDNIGMNSAKIFYAYEFNSTYYNASMTESGTDGHFFVTNVTMNVDIYDNLTNITYYVIGYDTDLNEARYNDTDGGDWNITVLDDVPPISTNGSGDFITYTGYPFWLWANFTDNFNISEVVLFYKRQSDTAYFQCNMTPGDMAGTFSATYDNLTQCSDINTEYSLLSIFYHVVAYDEVNNSGNYSKSGNDWEITVWDNTKPYKINVTGDLTTTTGEPFTIYGNFSDNINISYTDIYYKRKSTTGQGTTYDPVSMLETVGKPGNFYVNNDILGQDTYWDDRDILYYFLVHDISGNNITDRKTSGADYKITVVDNDKPWVISSSENITIGTGDKFDIYANFSDNIEIDFVRFFYRQESWSAWEFQDFSIEDDDSDNIWEFHISSSILDINIDTTNDGSDYFYYFRVFDGNTKKPNVLNYTYSTSGFKITVVDDDAPRSVKPKGTGNFITTTGEQFVIDAYFTDNVGINFSRIFVRSSSGSRDVVWPIIANMTESDSQPGRFYISSEKLGINTTIDDRDHEYYVECFDHAKNRVVYDDSEEPFTIEVIDNDKPFPIAGPNQAIEAETTVYFNGNASSDNIGIVSYTWTFVYKKLEQTLTGDKVSFKFDTFGDHIILLTVRDAQGNYARDDLWVNVSEKNYPPKIVAVNPNPEDGEKVLVIPDYLIDLGSDGKVDYKALRSEISVRFNESIKIDDINNIDFFSINDSAGNSVTGKFSWKSFTNKLVFEPDTALKYDETYTVTVTTAAMDLTGKHLEAEKTWSFNTHPEDSDSDGLLDSWELEHFYPEYHIFEVGPTADPDEDEFTNMEEFIAGTDPMNNKDHPPIKDGDSEKDNLNLIFLSVIGIIVVLIIIMLMIGILIFRKKKREEAESKKSKPIEHEILFDDVDGPPSGHVPTPGSGAGDTAAGVGGPTTAPATTTTTTTTPPPLLGQVEGEKERKTVSTSKTTLTSKTPTKMGQKDQVLLESALEEDEYEDEYEEEDLELTEDDLSVELDEVDSEIDGEIEDEIEDVGEIEDEIEDVDETENETEDVGRAAEEDSENIINDAIESGNEYFQDENYSDAIIQWQKALDLDPDQPEVLEKIQKAIELLK